MSTHTENYHLDPVDFNPFAGPEIELIVPLAKPQEEIWLSCKLGGDDANRSYNESVSLHLKGDLDVHALQYALEALILRHQSLRSTFDTKGSQLIIYQDWPLNLIYNDLSDQKPAAQQELKESFLQQEAMLTFDLENGPLFRTALFRLGEKEHFFTFSAHHIICDGWSLGILLQDLSKLYTAYHDGIQPALPEVTQMSQYITEQVDFIQTPAYQQTVQFWIEQFEHGVPLTELPLDFLRPAVRTYKSTRTDFILDSQLTSALKKTGIKTGCSFVITLFCAFEILMHKLCGQQELVLGLPTSGQAASGYYGLTGHCVNLLPIKSSMNEATTFNAYLKQRKSEILDVLENQQISLGTLVKLLHTSRDSSGVPLTPVVFNVDMNMSDGVSFKDLTYQLIYNPRLYETFEIFLNVSGSEEELTLQWSYNTQIFKAETINWINQSFQSLLQIISYDPNCCVNSISFPVKRSLSGHLKKWNQTTVVYPQKSLPALISQSLKKYPLKTAISFQDTSITNQQLLQKSNQLAFLLMKKGIGKGDIVGVALNRSIEMIWSILAVLKAGGAYVPVDPTYPQERVHYMLQDSGAKLLLVNTVYEGQFSAGIEELFLENILPELDSYSSDDPDVDISGPDLAYVLYTSGSTGRPKGVQIEHHNIVNLLNSVQKWPGITSNDRMLAISTISFDIAGLELFLPLISGAEIILADTKTAKDGFELLKLLKSAEVSLIQATPATFTMLLDAGWNDKLPLRVFCCGEALQLSLAKKLTARCASLWNMYGPTETTIYSTGKEISNTDELITIGRPIDNTRIYILDKQANLVPEGETGEIYIAGAGVARGYLNQPELTAARFSIENFGDSPGGLMYRTGDIGRFTECGEIEYLGRADHQIKIRGHRVELGEIETQLSMLENIKQVVVLAREDQPGNQQLVAYLLAPDVNDNTATQWISSWKAALRDILPPFMIPAHFIILDEFPLTPNNKIDRKLLPKPSFLSTDLSNDYTAPRTDTEKLIAAIWREALGLSAISIYDNFFEIGGHSLVAIQIMSRLEKETGKHLPLTSLFESSTIASLALLSQLEEKDIVVSSVIPIKATGNKIPLYLIPGSDSSVLIFSSIALYVDEDQPVYGLQGNELKDGDTPLRSMEEIAANYVNSMVKHYPSGPYAIAGYSFGGYVAIEVASQLRQMGKDIKMLAIFDTNAEEDFSNRSVLNKITDKILRQLKKAVWITSSLIKQPKSTIDYQFSYINKRLKPVFISSGVVEDEIIDDRYLLEVKSLVKQNDVAYQNYKMQPVNGTIDLFKAKKRIYFVDDFKYLGWKKYALKGVKVHDVPGDHRTMLQSPNDQVFGRVLQKCLNQSVYTVANIILFLCL